MSLQPHDGGLSHSLKNSAFSKKKYQSPGILFNAHLETIFPSLLVSLDPKRLTGTFTVISSEYWCLNLIKSESLH